MRRQPQLQDLLESMLKLLAQKPEHKDLFNVKNQDDFIKTVAETIAQKNSELTPRTIFESLEKNPALLKKLFFQLTLEAIKKKFDPENKGLDKVTLTPEQLAEIRKSLTALFDGVKDEKLKELAVENLLENLLRNNYTPRPKGPQSAKEDEKDLTVPQKTNFVAITDDAGNFIAFESYTSAQGPQFDTLSEIESRGASKVLEFLMEDTQLIKDAHGEVSKAAYPSPTLAPK